MEGGFHRGRLYMEDGFTLKVAFTGDGFKLGVWCAGWTYTPVLGSMPGLSFFHPIIMQTCSRLYACLRQFSNNDSICYCLIHMSSTLSPALGFFACCRLSCLTSALMPIVDFRVRPQLCRLFWALKPFVNFLACPRLCRLFSALRLSLALTTFIRPGP